MPTPFSARTEWEMRGSGPPTESQGGAYDASVSGAGIDYTQQDNAVLTHGDLVGNGTTTLTSVLGGFTSNMIGNAIEYFTAGQHVWRMITAVADTHTITVGEATTTFTGVTYHVGGACSPGALGFNFSDWVQAGQRLWLKGTFSTISNQWDLFLNGSASLPISFQGYQTTRGDDGFATWGMFLSTGANLTLSGSRWIVRNIVWDGGSAGGGTIFSALAVSGNRNLVDRCKFVGGATNNVQCVVTGGNNRFQRSYFNRAGRNGIPCVSNADNVTFDYCVFSGSGDSMGLRVDHGAALNHCIFEKNGGDGLNLASGEDDGVDCRHCNFYNNARDGIRVASTSAGLGKFSVLGCILGRNGGYDLNYSPTDVSANVTGAIDWENYEIIGNAFYTTGAGRFNNLPASSDAQALALSGDPFVSYAGGDFSLNTTAGAGRTVRSVALRADFLDGVNTGYYVMGAVQERPPNLLAVDVGDGPAIVAPEFVDTSFPVDVAEGAMGGLQFSTIVCIKGNGIEQRVPLYSQGRYRWDAGPGIKSPAQMALVTAFFAARQGKAYGFRWKDWDDYQATQQSLAASGAPNTQLVKTYESGGVTYQRAIFAPVAGQVAIRRNGSLYADWTVNPVTGIISWTPIIIKGITAITKAAAAVITVGSGHGFVNGDVVYVTGVAGMTELNDAILTVTGTALTTITVSVNSTAYTTYASGGTVAKYPQPADVLDWTGQFDVPVRFDVDEMRMTQESTGIRVCNQLPIIELTGE